MKCIQARHKKTNISRTKSFYSMRGFDEVVVAMPIDSVAEPSDRHSPLSVIDPVPNSLSELAIFEHAFCSLQMLYDTMCRAGFLKTTFDKHAEVYTKNGFTYEQVYKTRTLATHFLAESQTDGSNVVVSAMQIAIAHGQLEFSSCPEASLKCRLSKQTKAILATALILAHRFHVDDYLVRTPKIFTEKNYAEEDDEEDDCQSRKDKKKNKNRQVSNVLALATYLLFTDAEKRAFGEFSLQNQQRVDLLEKLCTDIKVKILTTLPVYRLCVTDNLYCKIEDRLDVMFKATLLDAEESMAARALSPFFAFASANSKTSAGVLFISALENIERFASALVAISISLIFGFQQERLQPLLTRCFLITELQLGQAICVAALYHDNKPALYREIWSSPNFGGSKLVQESKIRKAINDLTVAESMLLNNA
jgi:hypothetical protein